MTSTTTSTDHERIARIIARAIADGFTNGYEQFEEAGAPQQGRYLMAADAVIEALSVPSVGPEPVAWRAKLGAEARWILCTQDPTAEQHWHPVQPLFAHPPAVPATGDQGALVKAEASRHVGVGMVLAASQIVASHGEEVMATEILQAAGVETEASIRALGVEDYDINILRPVLKEMARRGALTPSDGAAS